MVSVTGNAWKPFCATLAVVTFRKRLFTWDEDSRWVFDLKVTITRHENLAKTSHELVALGIFEGEKALTNIAKKFDDNLGGLITKILRTGDFPGKLNKTSLVYPTTDTHVKRILLVGLGKKKEFSLETARNVSGKIAIQVRDLDVKTFVLFLRGDENQEFFKLVQVMVEAVELALYTFSRYKTEKDAVPSKIDELSLAIQTKLPEGKIKKVIEAAQKIADSTKVARDLANTPSSDMRPVDLAEAAQKIAKRPKIACHIIEKPEMQKLGMGGILGVSRGSQQPPKLIVLEYMGAGKNRKPVVLVGKAVTFDSGGISIKPSERMEEMKFDKSGGATVIAIVQAVADLELRVNVVGLVPATENLPSGSAYKPGDVLQMYGGKTAEIINTDAEGRLILGDALAYAHRYNPQAMIDFATLTGACIVALGTHASGLFSNNQKLVERITAAGEASGEKVWQFPLWNEYSEQIKSEIADMKNVGGKGGGAITAAAFLSKFVGNFPWAHIDIAGTAWTQEGSSEKSYIPKGATGIGVRLVVELLRNWKS